MKNNIKKKVIFIFTCLGLVLSGTFGFFYLGQKAKNPKEWEAYASSDERFEAQFPSDPKESAEEMDIANKKIEFHEVSSEDDGTIYSVSYIDFPGHWKWLGTNKLLTKSFDMFLENQKGVEEVLQKELATHQDNPALIYRFKQEGKEIQGKFVIAGNTLYRITVTYPLAAAEKIQPGAFLNSFQVKS